MREDYLLQYILHKNCNCAVDTYYCNNDIYYNFYRCKLCLCLISKYYSRKHHLHDKHNVDYNLAYKLEKILFD